MKPTSPGLVAGCDVIVDGMDNLPTRLLLNKTALAKKIPFIHGASMLEGEYNHRPGRTVCLRCLYRADIPERKFPVIRYHTRLLSRATSGGGSNKIHCGASVIY